ncbi:MAG: hypothetical protein PHC89_00690 [Candidatus Pacebacteria bacterium]|nr:hypothetical protein [Candidatus Paceibacterota bacterium]
MNQDHSKSSEEHRFLLEKNSALLKENNELLKKIHTNLRRNTLIKGFYYLLIVAFLVGTSIISIPYLKNLMNLYQGIGETIGTANQIPTIQEGNDLANIFQNLVNR